MSDKDIIWIDWARFWGISLVVFGHLLQVPENYSQTFLVDIWHWIYLFHMPLFFIISGYLFKQSESIAWSRLFKGLIVPYLLYQVLFLPIMLLSHLRQGQEFSDTFCKLIVGVLIGDGYDTPFSYTVCLPVWFIMSVIQLRLLFSKIKINRVSAVILSLSSILFLIIQKCLEFDLYGCLDSTIMAIPYFILGYVLKNYPNFDKVLSNKIQPGLVTGGGKIMVSAVLIIITVILLSINGPAQMNGPSCGKSVLLNYAAGFLGAMAIFLLSSYGNNCKFVKLISRNTLFLIFYHWIMIIVISHIGLGHLLNTLYNPLAQLALIIVLTVLILVSAKYAIILLQRKFPVILGK